MPTKPGSGVKRTLITPVAALEHVDRAAADALAAGERERVAVGVGRLAASARSIGRLELGLGRERCDDRCDVVEHDHA